MLTRFNTKDLHRIVVAIDSGTKLPESIARALKRDALKMLRQSPIVNNHYSVRDSLIQKLGGVLNGSDYQKSTQIKKLFLAFDDTNRKIILRNKYPACYELIQLIYNLGLTVPHSKKHISRILKNSSDISDI